MEASYHAATAYAAGEILEAAARTAGIAGAQGHTRTRSCQLDNYSVLGRFAVDRTGMQVKRLDMLIQWQRGRKEIVWPEEMRTRPAIFETRRRDALPSVAADRDPRPGSRLDTAGGLVLYFLVLRTISGYADENIRATLESLLRNAVMIADSRKSTGKIVKAMCPM